MAPGFDVAARLSEGVPAVEDFSTYVWACRMRGYSHPELTAHPGQVRELYSAEDGVELALLDADCVTLRDGASALGDAIALARRQVGALQAGWAGPGAESGVEFVQRHCAAAQLVTSAWLDAATACADLRDEVWRAVDGRVAATAAAARGAQQGSWLPAARAVLAGEADETAVGIVDRHVRPFVDAVIGQQWVGDMQSATAAIRAAYRTALDRIRSARRAQFEIPGDMGPRADLVPAAVPASVTPNWVNSAAPLGVPTPAGSIPPAAALPEPFAAGPAAAPIPEPVVANPAAAPMSEALGANPAPPAPAPAPAAPLTLPELGNLGGLADPPRLDQPNLDPAAPDPVPEPDAESDEGLTGDDAESEAAEDEAGEDAEESEAEPGRGAEPDSAEPDPEESGPAPGPAPEGAAADPEAPPDPDCPPSAPAPPPEPATPCEMAADELPQVGQ
ncbi:hypothetical protein [Mycolicibacterium confluentis]|uniref:Uncharacterized protein n=1 Tax=Mycolicibacterium confluentis TaxID=28047 RepID=A0A7I7Y0B2_9MYCO|nr:hypothetical protein [Mycolicibacterium confluentis]MCV7320075.1 hypothetical protein [Mycolicibacterium confluentis]ORV34614.1 hypothetical protein AWB99_03175 [Mycolicibacterium confluentis]BBZ35110.1 hypothetical protein MCNF_37150 [Mycolicibacterium confluentis]